AADAQSSAETAQILLALYEAARVEKSVSLPLSTKGEVIRALFGLPPDTNSSQCVYPRPHPVSSEENYQLASEGGVRLVQRWFPTAPKVGLPELLGVSRVVLSGKMNAVEGHVVRQFEKEFAAAYGSKAAVASTSGTAAIHVAIGALNPEPCDEIIT